MKDLRVSKSIEVAVHREGPYRTFWLNVDGVCEVRIDAIDDDVTILNDPEFKLVDCGDYTLIDPVMIESIQRFVKTGCPVGNFLFAVLSNDFMEAIARADENNLKCIPQIAGYVYNETPGMCHGSPEKVNAWTEQGGNGGLR